MPAAPLNRMMRQGVVAIAIRFLSAALGFGLIFVLARWMKVDEFGHFGFAFSLATTMAAVLDMGQRRLILRSLAAYMARGRADLMSGVLRFSLVVTIVGAVAGALVVVIGAAALGGHKSLYPAALLTAVIILSEYQSNALRSLGSLIRSLVPREIVWRPLSLGLLAAAGGGLSIVTDATTALWTLAVVLLVLSLSQLVFVFRPTWRRALARVTEDERVDSAPEETLESARTSWRASSWRLWVVSAINEGLTPASVVIVGLFVPPAATGAFFAAVRMATIIAFPLQGLNLMVGPMLARSHASGDRARLQHVATFTAASASAAALVGAVVLILFGRQLLGAMEPSFAASNDVQLVIMAGFVVAALCGSSGQLMNMTGHDREFVGILVVFNSIGFVALAALSAAYGGMGAAWALLLSKAGWNLAVTVWARRNLGIDPSVFALIRPPKGVQT